MLYRNGGVSMIDSIHVENFCQHSALDWGSLGHINLIIGANSSGKTVLLKSIYVALKALEQCGKGQDKRSLAEILADKLYWTFQTEKLGDLVQKGQSSLSFTMEGEDRQFSYRFGRDTKQKISQIKNNFTTPREIHSIFIPAKEVLSLFQVISKSRDQDSMFGFDDTYLDLVKALQMPSKKGNNYKAFMDGKKLLAQLIHGHIEYDDASGEWYYKRGNSRFPIGTTSEGIKKVSIFSKLLSNRYLNTDSIVFIDEIESALHPNAVIQYLNMIHELSQAGMQFFIATRSYFVIKKMYLLARENEESLPVLSLAEGKEPLFQNMKDGMPENSIIDTSVKLYEEEVELAMNGK